jgi:E3 ubiquitin-protein ligase DOA10
MPGEEDRITEFGGGKRVKSMLKEDTMDENGTPFSCKICYSGAEEENPLVQICDCIGSVQYLHVMCLKTWIEKQIQRKENGAVITYLMKKF